MKELNYAKKRLQEIKDQLSFASKERINYLDAQLSETQKAKD